MKTMVLLSWWACGLHCEHHFDVFETLTSCRTVLKHELDTIKFQKSPPILGGVCQILELTDDDIAAYKNIP